MKEKRVMIEKLKFIFYSTHREADMTRRETSFKFFSPTKSFYIEVVIIFFTICSNESHVGWIG